MLDLGKQYGTYQGITFYGDHEDEALVYYLPNEVKLANGKNSHHEMDLMLFRKSNVVSTDAINMDDIAGAFLQMGVICTADERKLNRALDELKDNVKTLPEDIKVSQPVWKDGTVDVMILDKQKDAQGDDNASGFVKNILGSQKPSFMTNDLKSIFNVRLDHRGSELIYSALKGSKSSLAGVMYNLQFAALQPTANLRISANLSKCQETVEHELGLSGTYENGSFNVTVGVDVNLLTKKMEENGDIKIEVLSMMETEEDKKRFNQIVDEFKDRIIEELFTPDFSEQLPEQANAATSDNKSDKDGGQNVVKDVVDIVKEAVKNNNQATEKGGDEKTEKGEDEKADKDGNDEAENDGDENDGDENDGDKDKDKKGSSGKGSIQLHYSYKKQKIESNKVLMVDYRERATVIKTHNPQSHLWLFGLQLGDKFTDYVTQVEMNDLWKTQNIRTNIDATSFDSSDLKFAEVAFWRQEYGVNTAKSNAEFAIPDGVSPLVAMLTKEDPEMNISWTRNDKDEAGYYYQVRFGFTDQEIVSEPMLSYSSNLLIVPELCIFNRKLHIMSCGINYDIIRNVDVRLDITDPDGTRPPEYLILSADHNEDTLIVRSRYRDKTSIQMTRTIDLNNGTKIANESSVFGSEIPVYNPLLNRELTLVFSGISDEIDSVIMDATVNSAGFTGGLKYHFVFKDFSSVTTEASINILDENDTVSYKLNAISSNGDIIPLEGGIAGDEPIQVKLAGAVSDKPKNLCIEWDGKSPDDADIKRVEVYIKEEDKEEIKYEFKGSSVPAPVQLKISVDADVTVRIEKRFFDGHKDVQKNVPVQDGKIVVQCP